MEELFKELMLENSILNERLQDIKERNRDLETTRWQQQGIIKYLSDKIEWLEKENAQLKLNNLANSI